MWLDSTGAICLGVLSKAPALFFPFAVANVLDLTLFSSDPPSLRLQSTSMGSAKPLAWVKLGSHLGQQGEMKMRKRRGEMQGEAFMSCLRYYIPSSVLLGLVCVLQNLLGKPNDKQEQHVCYSKALSLNIYTCRGKRGAIIRLCARQIPGQRSWGSARGTRSRSHWKIKL